MGFRPSPSFVSVEVGGCNGLMGGISRNETKGGLGQGWPLQIKAPIPVSIYMIIEICRFERSQYYNLFNWIHRALGTRFLALIDFHSNANEVELAVQQHTSILFHLSFRCPTSETTEIICFYITILFFYIKMVRMHGFSSCFTIIEMRNGFRF